MKQLRGLYGVTPDEADSARLMAQVRPGEEIQFRMITAEEGYAASTIREHQLGRIRQSLAVKLAQV